METALPDEKTKEILYNCADQLKSVMEGKYTYKVFDLVDGQVRGLILHWKESLLPTI